MIATKLDHGDADTARQVRRYERDHKDRSGVVHAAELISLPALLNPYFDRTFL